MRPQRTPMKPPRKHGHRHPNAPTDPVEVCARIRNLTESGESCIKVLNNTTLQLLSQDNRVTECQFYQVFNKNVSQKQLFNTIAEPMVDDLLKGKSSLLFTYGVTSSGKTYTMTGTVDEPGFLPRSLDMIFNSISGVQSSKYVICPDKMNWFDVKTEADALLRKQEQDFLPTLSNQKTPRKRKNADVRYEIEHCFSENINPECRFAVFVSYVEIYNDYIYDLLDEVQLDAFNRPRPPQSKKLREDREKNMFVYGANEIEVKSTEEAFAAFHQGQERRRIAHTQLNTESSRSHSIFNIRLVQAPLDPLGEDLLQEKSLIGVSQLALVDLAGSERTGRTGAGGERLREAGNINSSLMTLRRCLEQLRENQKNGTCDMVKYRNSKLTHLFKSFFEGRGKVKMVVCLNPNMQEHDENFHVVQFAEVAQQVEVARPDEYKVDHEAIRRKAFDARLREEEEKRKRFTAMRQLSNEAASHRLFKRSKSQVTGGSSESETDTDWEGIDFRFDSFPNLEVADAMDEETLPSLISFLEHRKLTSLSMKRTADALSALCRGNMTHRTQSDIDLGNKLKEYEAELSTKSKDLVKVEKQVKKLESKNQVLTKTTQVYERDKKQLQDQLNDTELQLKNAQMEIRKMDNKLRGAVENTKAQYEKQCERRVRNVQTEMQEKMWVKDERLRQLKDIISDGGREGRYRGRNPPTPSSSSSNSSISSHTRFAHKRRSRSAENLLSDRKVDKSLAKTRVKSTSNEDLHQTKPKKVSSKEIQLQEDDLNEALLVAEGSQPEQSFVTTRSRSRRHHDRDRGDSPCMLMDQENIYSLGCTYVNRNDEDRFRHRPAPPIAPKHRRSCSVNNSHWLAHLPNTTVQPETILQPAIRPNRVVNVPSPKDVASASKYLLTHQLEDKNGEIETQLVKGEVFHTRTGGQQVQFVDVETLKQSDPKKKTSPPRKRKSATSVDELSSGEQSSWTDVETRCAYGIGSSNLTTNTKRKK